MIGKLISLVFFFVIGWVVYTQIFGTVKEQEMGQEVISNGKETIESILISSSTRVIKFRPETMTSLSKKLANY